MRAWPPLAEFMRRLSRLVDRERHATELEDEMRLHLDLRAERFEQQGLAAADARVAARRRFGNALSLQEKSRDEWGLRWLEQLGQDIRYGARMLRRSPAFAAIAIGAVGIAIGINAGFFTFVDAFVFQPYPVAHPERLVRLLTIDGRRTTNIRFSYPELTDIASHSRTLTDVVGYDAEPVAVKVTPTVPAAASSVGLVTGNYFSAWGGTATLGRVFSASDDQLGEGPSVVISDGYWERAFGRARDVIGRDIIVNGARATIVGVASPTFVGMNPLVPDMWMTLARAARIGIVPGRLLDDKNRFIVVHARLADAFTLHQAGAEVSGMIAEPPERAGTRAALDRITGATVMRSESLLPPSSQLVLMLTPALLLLGLILIIACSNLANLLLSRGLTRQREIAVRLSLGAERGRLVRQLVTESLLIACAGSALGFLVGWWTVDIVSRSFFAFVPPTAGSVALTLRPSWHVLAYTVLLTVVSTLTFGLVPALHTTSPSLTGMLKGDDSASLGGVRRSPLRDALVAAQVAASVVLIAAAAILTRGVQRFATNSTGLNVSGVVLAQFGLAPSGHLTPTLANERATFASRVAHLATVRKTARVAQPPFSQWNLLHIKAYDGRSSVSTAFALPTNRVTPGYFEVVDQRIVEGRGFSAADSTDAAPVAVLSSAAAHTLWPRRQAVGQMVRIVGANGADSTALRIVGVVADAHSGMLWDSDSQGYIYLPATANDFATLDMPLLVRDAGDPSLTARAIADAATAIDINAPLISNPLLSLHEQQIMPFRYAATITGSVAALGFALALVGLYGVVSFAVQQRRREIAVHVAIGASPRTVLRLVIRRELRLIVIGLLAGLVLALAEAGLIGHLTLPIPPLGALGLLAVALSLLVAATIAALIPAAAALRIAPMQVLRQE